MTWTLLDATRATDTQLLRAIKTENTNAQSITISGLHPNLKGVYGAGTFFNAQGVRAPKNTNLLLGDVVEVNRDYRTPSFAGGEGSNEEAGESYVLIDSSSHTLIILELTQPIDPAIFPATISIELKYRQTDSGGTSAMQSATVNMNGLSTDTSADIMQKFLDGLLALVDSYGNPFVACLPEQSWVGSIGAGNDDAKFTAWVEPASGLSGTESLFVMALSHEQDTAYMTFSAGGQTLLFSPNNGRMDITEHHYAPAGSLRTNKIRDVRYNESSIGSAYPYVAFIERDDLDIQSSLFRSAQGANQQYYGLGVSSGAVSLQPEIVNPGVMRYATIEITPSTFAAPSYNLVNNAVVALPWPNDTYYSEGPCILKDAFLELHTPFVTSDAQYPISLDIGIDCPDLYPEAGFISYHKGLGTLASYRSFYGSVLRDLQIDDQVAAPTSQMGGNTLGTNTAMPGVETHKLGSFSFFASPYSSNEERWISGNNLAPTIPGTIGPFNYDIIVENWHVEYQHLASNSMGALSLANPLIFEFYVLPPSTGIATANWVTVNTQLDFTTDLWRWPVTGHVSGGVADGKIVFSTASIPPGTIKANNNIGIRLPAGYRLAPKITFPSTTGLIDVSSNFNAYVNTHRATTKGVALTGPQSILVDPFSAPTGSLIATISRRGAMEIDIATPSPNTNIKDILTAGKAYLHLHFWQAKRKTTEIAWNPPQGALTGWPW